MVCKLPNVKDSTFVHYSKALSPTFPFITISPVKLLHYLNALDPIEQLGNYKLVKEQF